MYYLINLDMVCITHSSNTINTHIHLVAFNCVLIVFASMPAVIVSCIWVQIWQQTHLQCVDVADCHQVWSVGRSRWCVTLSPYSYISLSASKCGQLNSG